MFFLDFILMILGVFMSVAFFTLMERKILGYSQFRKGPSKLFYFGLFQPISDALKLFSKSMLKGFKFSFFIFFIGPFLGLALMVFLWSVYCGFFGIFGSFYSMMFIFSVMSLTVYFFLFCGRGGNSKFSLLGAYRAISQSISYEISFIFFMLFIIFLISSFDLGKFFFFQFGYWFFFMSNMFSVSWIFIILSESNRSPFDFSEGESELVSGFNVEFGGGIFSLIFICEYGMLIFLGFISSSFLLGGVSFLQKIMFFSFLLVWIRCCFPRFRYDLLMNVGWKILVPLSLSFLLLSVAFF